MNTFANSGRHWHGYGLGGRLKARLATNSDRALEPRSNAKGPGKKRWMTRPLSIVVLLVFATFSAAAVEGGRRSGTESAPRNAGPEAKGLARTASNPMVCATPQISARTRYHGEKVECDLGISFTLINKKQERVWGKYETEREVDVKTNFEGECLRRLDVVVDVFPVIHLIRDYKDNQYRCARQSVLDRERRHRPIVRRRYDGLPQQIETLAADLFSRTSDGGHEAIVEQLAQELDDGPFIKKFLSDLEKEQDTFRARELRDGSIAVVDCRLVNRPGNFPALEGRNEIVLKCRDEKGRTVKDGLHAKTRGRKMSTLKCTRK